MSEDAAQARGSEFFPYAASFVAGLVVCLALTIASDGREAVDTAGYFPIGIPLMAFTIFAISYVFPARPARWTLSTGGRPDDRNGPDGVGPVAVADCDGLHADLFDSAVHRRSHRIAHGQAARGQGVMGLLQILFGLGLLVIAYRGHQVGEIRAGTGPIKPYTPSRNANPLAFHFFLLLYICGGLALLVWGVFVLLGLMKPMPL